MFDHSGQWIAINDHYPVVAKVMERLAVNKQRSHRFHIERFNFKKLNEVEGKEKYHVDISNRFAALEDLDAEVEIIVLGKRLERILTFQPKRV
jgi:hypothetical protein